MHVYHDYSCVCFVYACMTTTLSKHEHAHLVYNQIMNIYNTYKYDFSCNQHPTISTMRKNILKPSGMVYFEISLSIKHIFCCKTCLLRCYLHCARQSCFSYLRLLHSLLSYVYVQLHLVAWPILYIHQFQNQARRSAKTIRDCIALRRLAALSRSLSDLPFKFPPQITETKAVLS